ncbi:hypothetical protein OHS58_00825 [Amycolatopsis sp. NBC_00348]|uniref:hypothetical protein n=1 Tax=Amycolatopsis sp. NBC_00348 TaxID=2975956 RepID=UPI002E27577F
MTRKHTPEHVTELARQLTPVKRPNPFLWAYHWRYEVAAVTLLPYSLVVLFQWLGPLWFAVALAGAFHWVFYWRAGRRYLRGRLRAIVVQHRLRATFARARVCTLDGRRPAILWTRERDGEILVTVFCPAGLEFRQIRDARALIASACFATEVYVDRHPRFASLVTVAVCTAPPRWVPAQRGNPQEIVPLRVHS